jgi:beta-glucosidase
MANAESRALARHVAGLSMVLLKNEPVAGRPVLPLDHRTVTSIALIGRLAVAPNMGDHGSSDVRPPSHCTPLEGIREAFPGARIVTVAEDDPAAAAAAARQADVAIVVAGFDARDEGEYVGSDTMRRPELLALFPPPPAGAPAGSVEAAGSGQPVSPDASPNIMTEGDNYGGDRGRLTLRTMDEEIIRGVALANPRTVVCLVAAGAVLTEGWRHEVPAVLMMWYAGMEGGRALADVLTGVQNPSGRLPFSIPTSAEHLPLFERSATQITYDRWHGQRLLDRLGVAPAFPHGFGLSYTTFSIRSAAPGDVGKEGVRVTVTVSNTGERDGRHVVQVYGRRLHEPYAGELMLCGFAGVDVPAGGTARVDVEVSFTALAGWDSRAKRRVPPAPGEVVLEVGAYAHDPAALVVRF